MGFNNLLKLFNSRTCFLVITYKTFGHLSAKMGKDKSRRQRNTSFQEAVVQASHSQKKTIKAEREVRLHLRPAEPPEAEQREADEPREADQPREEDQPPESDETQPQASPRSPSPPPTQYSQLSQGSQEDDVLNDESDTEQQAASQQTKTKRKYKRGYAFTDQQVDEMIDW